MGELCLRRAATVTEGSKNGSFFISAHFRKLWTGGTVILRTGFACWGACGHEHKLGNPLARFELNREIAQVDEFESKTSTKARMHEDGGSRQKAKSPVGRSGYDLGSDVVWEHEVLECACEH